MVLARPGLAIAGLLTLFLCLHGYHVVRGLNQLLWQLDRHSLNFSVHESFTEFVAILLLFQVDHVTFQPGNRCLNRLVRLYARVDLLHRSL